MVKKLSLWVYAFPPTRCTTTQCKDKDGNQAENTVSGHNAGTCPNTDHYCPKAVVKFTGTVTYSYDCVELVSD